VIFLKTIKFLLLIGFCMMGAGMATSNVTFQVIGLIACVVLLCAYFIVRRNERTRQLNAQIEARQGITSEMLTLEYNDLINANILAFTGQGKSTEQVAAMAMNKTMATLMKKYGYTTDELGRMLVEGR